MALPVVINGQIMPGDVDRFRFQARRGERLVIDVAARRLVPYLADAVPGWFQATLALFDDEGNEVAFSDDYRFDPDPVLLYKVRKTGEYALEIRDSIYRGREDFVYRIAVGPRPFITQMFPLGGPAGVETFASIDGWNLTNKRLPLDTEAEAGCVRYTALRRRDRVSNRVTYAVDTLPECKEAEPNDTLKEAQQIERPQITLGLPTNATLEQIDGIDNALGAGIGIGTLALPGSDEIGELTTLRILCLCRLPRWRPRRLRLTHSKSLRSAGYTPPPPRRYRLRSPP